MSTFNRFCAKAKNAADKVSAKAEEWADSASRSVKTKSLQIRIDEQYEKLGELFYRSLHTEENLEDEKLQIIAAIDALFDKITALKKEGSAEEKTEGEEKTEKETQEPETEEKADAPEDCSEHSEEKSE